MEKRKHQSHHHQENLKNRLKEDIDHKIHLNHHRSHRLRKTNNFPVYESGNGK